MRPKEVILLFEEKKVRTVWDSEQEKWGWKYHHIV